MPSQEKQVKFEQLPPRVRQAFEGMRARLGSQLTLNNYRAIQGGWVASVCTLDGRVGGENLVLAEPGEESLG